MKATSKFINEIKVSYSKKEFSDTTIRGSRDAFQVAQEIYHATNCGIELKEYFFILILNRANNVVGYHKLSEGGISSTVVDIRIAFATALKSLASGIILLHNHPSGNLTASECDKSITNKFVAAGNLLEIEIVDHIILGTTGYYSFADNGMI